jgi:diaminopimelate decarboxylase
MDHFAYQQGRIYCEDLALDDLARAVGTPAYVYSLATVRHHVQALQEGFAALDPLICYAVKANGNLALLRHLHGMGVGFDLVSGGELNRVLVAGADPRRIVFSGVGKTREEMRAALDIDVLMFNVESQAEVDLLAEVAAGLSKTAGVAIRVNPDVDPGTHRYISTGQRATKFGVDLEEGAALAARVANDPHLELRGIQCHIGSQITSVDPYVAAVKRIVELAVALRARFPTLKNIDIGGGFGIWYRDRSAPSIAEYAEALVPLIQPSGLRLVMEPGRLIVGNAGVLLTRVLFNKRAGDRRFVIVDAGMNDLIRPSLYEGYHRIWPVTGPPPPPLGDESDAETCHIVGPVCETGDFLAKDRPLPPVAPGDTLAVFSAGAYGFVLASNYNDRCRPPEVLVDGGRYSIVRVRESHADLLRYDRPDAPFQALPGAGAAT